MPLVRRTRATLRRAEFGFFGVVVYTRGQTPRLCGHSSSAGTWLRAATGWRALRINGLIVGIRALLPFNLVVGTPDARRCKNPPSKRKLRLVRVNRQTPSEKARVRLCRSGPLRQQRLARERRTTCPLKRFADNKDVTPHRQASVTVILQVVL